MAESLLKKINEHCKILKVSWIIDMDKGIANFYKDVNSFITPIRVERVNQSDNYIECFIENLHDIFGKEES